MCKISIVIPVYNGEKFLQECIDSVLAQTFIDFEIILVDDGSVDNTAIICDNYVKHDSRIKVIHQINGGVTFARRKGVQMARGEWICFVDSDDTIPSDSLSCLFDVCKKYDTDFVVGHCNTVTFSYPSQIPLDRWRECCCAGEYLAPIPFGKLIRKSLFTEWVLDIPREINKGEDMLMNVRLSFNMTKAPVVVYKKIYNYRRNTASISHTKRASIEYEMLFDEIRKQSIPAEQLPNNIEAIIRSRLNGLIGPAHFEPKVLCNKQHPYLKQLKDDIRKYGYHMNFQEWMLLNIRWPWLYKAFSFLVSVKNFLCYRLGMNN